MLNSEMPITESIQVCLTICEIPPKSSQNTVNLIVARQLPTKEKLYYSIFTTGKSFLLK